MPDTSDSLLCLSGSSATRRGSVALFLAAASLAAKGDISVSTALLAIAAALGSNLLVKCALAFSSGGRSFGLAFIAGMAAPTVVFAAVLTVVLR